MILMENGGKLLLKIQNTQGNYSICPKLSSRGNNREDGEGKCGGE
jgi:hypothetical protein